MAGKIALTAPNIRYLITIQSLDKNGSGVRCVDVASALGLSKPSVHSMMATFIRMNLVSKDSYGAAFLTDKGRATAARYSRYYDAVTQLLQRNFPEAENIQTAACSLMSELPEECLSALCKRRQAVQN